MLKLLIMVVLVLTILSGAPGSPSGVCWISGVEAHAATIQLPQTGQTKCYKADGTETTNCAGTGQDGDKLAGKPWPAPRFTVNMQGDGVSPNGTITDNLTGLIWLQNANCTDTAGIAKGSGDLTWTDALKWSNALASEIGACGLADGSVAGNWRLPNRNELLSLVNYQEANVGWLDIQGFSDTREEYWTSDSYLPVWDGLNNKWTVNLKSGNTDYWGAGDLYAVLPVRDYIAIIGASPASNDFGSVNTNAVSASVPFILTNTGLDPLLVSSIAISGGDSGMFTLNKGDGTLGTCGETPTIAPAGSCTVSVSFTPISIGDKSTSLRISSNDPATPNKDVALNGSGVLPTYAIGTAVVGGNGSVTCTSPVEGGDSACIITPSIGYHLDTFTDNTVDKLASVANGSYTISNVLTPHAIQGMFAINNYSVSFTSNGGSAVTGQSVAYNTPATQPTAPTKSGSTFAGWYSDATLTSAVNFATPITGNTTLYAKWTTTIYSVSFDSNGGSQVTGQSVASNTPATQPTAPTKSGYTFAGWYSDAALTSVASFATPITGNTTLYAKWTAIAPITYIVTSVVGSGSNVTPATVQTVNNGATTSFTIAPVAGYGILTVTGCNGTLSGTTYTTGAITGDCSVIVNAVKRSGSGGTATGPTIVDAQKALKAFIGVVQLTPEETIRYDVAPLAANGVPLGNGVVDMADAIMILRRSIGIGAW